MALPEYDINKLEEIFRVVLALPEDSDISNVRQINQDKWDSLAHTSLIAAIESEFNFTFDLKDYDQLTSFEASKLIILEKLK